LLLGAPETPDRPGGVAEPRHRPRERSSSPMTGTPASGSSTTSA